MEIGTKTDKNLVGLPNLGNTCFMSAVLQTIHKMAHVRTVITQASRYPTCTELLKELASVFQKMDGVGNSTDGVKVDGLYTILQIPNVQSCASEFFTITLERITNDLTRMSTRSDAGQRLLKWFETTEEIVLTGSDRKIEARHMLLIPARHKSSK